MNYGFSIKKWLVIFRLDFYFLWYQEIALLFYYLYLHGITLSSLFFNFCFVSLLYTVYSWSPPLWAKFELIFLLIGELSPFILMAWLMFVLNSVIIFYNYIYFFFLQDMYFLLFTVKSFKLFLFKKVFIFVLVFYTITFKKCLSSIFLFNIYQVSVFNGILLLPCIAYIAINEFIFCSPIFIAFFFTPHGIYIHLPTMTVCFRLRSIIINIKMITIFFWKAFPIRNFRRSWYSKNSIRMVHRYRPPKYWL